MTDTVLNVAAGKVAEYAARVNANDPANSALIVVLLASTGLESHAVLRDKDTLADLVAGATNEATNTGYARKTLDNTAGITITVDDTNNWVDVDIPDLTWMAVANDGTGAIGMLVLCYDPDTAAGTDANIVPLSLHDFSVSADGSDVTAQIATGGFFRATT